MSEKIVENENFFGVMFYTRSFQSQEVSLLIPYPFSILRRKFSISCSDHK